MSKPLESQVAVITGSGRGIGRAIAVAFAAAGMKVVCSARSQTEIEATAEHIREQGGDAQAVVCDVTDPISVEALCASAELAFGGIDLFFVNAGMASDGAIVENGDTSLWRRVIEVNLIAPMEQCRAVIPYLRRRGGGKILFTGSGVARGAAPGSSAYACSKAGVAMLNRILARELRDANIAVNEIIPGPVRTRMTGIDEEAEGRDEEGAPILSVPGEWIKNPDDVAPLALFIAGLPNNGPTGQSFSLVGRDLGRI